jgi:8-oxo-dGTP diphosphatase
MANRRDTTRAKKIAQAPIEGAGGIVVREGAVPLIAIVQRRKDNDWVLPKGKLKAGESAIVAAEREVLEETGCDAVSVHEFLGVISYNSPSGKPKVVQFWRMQADGNGGRKLMRDIKTVKWLALEPAVKRLDHPLEQLFLRNIGPTVLSATTAGLAQPILAEPIMVEESPAPQSEQATSVAIPEPTLVVRPLPDSVERRTFAWPARNWPVRAIWDRLMLRIDAVREQWK